MTENEYNATVVQEAVQNYNLEKDGNFDEYMEKYLTEQPKYEELTPKKKRKYSQAQNRATQKFIKENYDHITIRVPKGHKTIYKAFAAQQGKSLNQFILDKINQ